MLPTDIDAVPRRRDAVIFEAKAWCHRLLRWRSEALRRPPRHRPTRQLAEAPVLAEFRGPLWPEGMADRRWTIGKIHNLRLAARAFHGIEPPPHAVLSFWRQLGRATRRRGFALGRELREGCLVPSRGGGLCQLSNALHDCAVRAGLTVLERHRHSRVLPGSLAEQDRDATVFWNYLDLRLAAPFAWRIEVQLDATNLHVRIRGHAARGDGVVPSTAMRKRNADAVADCSGCGRVECHRHARPAPAEPSARTWLVTEEWPEHRRYREAEHRDGDRLVRAPAAGRLWIRLWRRRALWKGLPLPHVRLEAMRREARALAGCLRPEDVDVVVSQGLLPFLWRDGVLGGRRFDVLMTALPMAQLHARLDAAVARHPHSPTLADFRAPAWLLEAETQGLAAATRWITPHAIVAMQAGSRAHRLPWERPSPVSRPAAPTRPAHVLFAGPSLARKGAFEMRAALGGLTGMCLLLPPGAHEAPGFWKGRRTRTTASLEEGIRLADIVVLPAWVEHQPRGLLLALASGVPVIATEACGLPPGEEWLCVPEGDGEALRSALQRVLARSVNPV